MDFLLDVGRDAIEALTGGLEGELWEVLSLTLIVGVVATAIGVTVGVPLGTALGLWRFPGHRPLLVAVKTLP